MIGITIAGVLGIISFYLSDPKGKKGIFFANFAQETAEEALLLA